MKSGIFKQGVLVFLVLQTVLADAQDLFNYDNSKSFADYLYNTKRFELSQREYQRVLFLKPTDTSSWINLVKSYHFIRDFKEALAFTDSAESTLGQGNKRLGMLRTYSYLKMNEFDMVDQTVEDYPFSQNEKTILTSSRNALSGNWNYFDDFPERDNYWIKSFKSMAAEIRADKKKRPYLAGIMSAIIPGSGKIYSKRGKDGLFSFVLVGTTAWQASRLISRRGITNVGSIFFSGFALGLYSGNIYGSVKAARNYNQRLEIKNNERSNELVDLYFGY